MQLGNAARQADPPGRSATDAPLLGALELFAGAGGMAVAAHRAGFELLDLIEWNEPCCATLRANADHFGWKDPDEIAPRDVRTVDFTEYRGRIALLTAGPPCQPFSLAGRRQGRDDERDLFPEVVRAVAECQPRAFLIENVRGLLFRHAVEYLESIVGQLRRPSRRPGTPSGLRYNGSRLGPPEDDDYRVDYALLNAADFGLPQYRPRLFIVGVRRDEACFKWPSGEYSRASLVLDLLGREYWLDHPEVSRAARKRARHQLVPMSLPDDTVRWRTLRDMTVELGPPARSWEAADDPAHTFVKGARLYGKHTGSKIDWLGKTVKAGVHGSPGGEHIVVATPKRFRYLTVRECSYLQGFPGDYQWPEKRTPAMRQLGNAVPIEAPEAVLRVLHGVMAAERHSIPRPM